MNDVTVDDIVERVIKRLTEIAHEGFSSPSDEEVEDDGEKEQKLEVSKKTAKKQVKALGGPKFKDKEEKAEEWGVKDPGAFVASRMDKAHGKSWRKKGSKK
jgi:hypothetical protein